MKIHLLILDVDGVLTDGSIFITEQGQEIKKFNALDGYGLNRLVKSGLPIAIISGRHSEAVNHHLRRFGIEDIYQGQQDKTVAFKQLLDKYDVHPGNVAYVGDDLPDLPLMQQVGMPIAVANAVVEIKHAAHWITKYTGGRGAVREVCDYLYRLRTQQETVLCPQG